MTIETVTRYKTWDGELHDTWEKAELHDLKKDVEDLFNSCQFSHDEGLDIEELIKTLRTDRNKALRLLRFVRVVSGIAPTDTGSL